MTKAFVLINCELGSEEHVISELKTFPDVKEVHGTFGAYDIIAKISSETKAPKTVPGIHIKPNLIPIPNSTRF